MPSHVRPAGPVRRLTRATLAVAAGLVLALLATGGTYAYLSRSTTTGGATVTAGTAGFTVATGAAVSLTGLYPGSASYGSYTLTNTGDVPLALSVSSLTVTSTPAALASAVVLDLAVQPAGTTCSAADYTQVTRSGSATGTMRSRAA